MDRVMTNTLRTTPQYGTGANFEGPCSGGREVNGRTRSLGINFTLCLLKKTTGTYTKGVIFWSWDCEGSLCPAGSANLLSNNQMNFEDVERLKRSRVEAMARPDVLASQENLEAKEMQMLMEANKVLLEANKMMREATKMMMEAKKAETLNTESFCTTTTPTPVNSEAALTPLPADVFLKPPSGEDIVAVQDVTPFPKDCEDSASLTPIFRALLQQYAPDNIWVLDTRLAAVSEFTPDLTIVYGPRRRTPEAQEPTPTLENILCLVKISTTAPTSVNATPEASDDALRLLRSHRFRAVAYAIGMWPEGFQVCRVLQPPDTARPAAETRVQLTEVLGHGTAEGQRLLRRLFRVSREELGIPDPIRLPGFDPLLPIEPLMPVMPTRPVVELLRQDTPLFANTAHPAEIVLKVQSTSGQEIEVYQALSAAAGGGGDDDAASPAGFLRLVFHDRIEPCCSLHAQAATAPRGCTRLFLSPRLERIDSWTAEMALAAVDRLQYLHRQHYLAVDVRPQNWMMLRGPPQGAPPPEVFLIDFGLALRFGEYNPGDDDDDKCECGGGTVEVIAGDPSYASLAVLRDLGTEEQMHRYTPADDLEALVHCVMSCVLGRCPPAFRLDTADRDLPRILAFWQNQRVFPPCLTDALQAASRGQYAKVKRFLAEYWAWDLKCPPMK
ncbi:hypothetical protein PAPYR_7076 [Paratrimastix pyriformis]|uniref:Protein kinase domain-containing protein n=1 Tax=Paratrimastix pyriformis TaxID=342808 RepID=A0ABQ8UDX0_9EUKA|nr:hypothetical protein PAPYR_7076 [Paratrimastix pyriformis]